MSDKKFTIPLAHNVNAVLDDATNLVSKNEELPRSKRTKTQTIKAALYVGAYFVKLYREGKLEKTAPRDLKKQMVALLEAA